MDRRAAVAVSLGTAYRVRMGASRILITGAQIIDGTGAPARTAEVLIEEDVIAAVGDISGLPAPTEVVEAGGRTLTPGFIDVHSHGDFVLPSDPEAAPKVRQGITTEVVANCGLGLSPANERVQDMYRQFGQLFGGDGSTTCSPDLEHYRKRLESTGVGVNVACLIPHGNVRCAVLGMDERKPTPTEVEHMQSLVSEVMAQGAFGMSSGLVYPPGAYAETEELISLAEMAAAAGGLYASHVRDEGTHLEASIEEALTIGEQAGLPVQISHHKASGHSNWGKVRKTLAMLDAARERGLEVHSDMYPYTAGSTMLAAMLVPLWVFSGSSPEESLQRLADRQLRPRIVRDAKKRLEEFIVLPGFLNYLPKGPLVPAVVRKLSDLVVIGSVKRQKQYEGKTLREVAAMRGRPLIEALLDLLVEEDAAVTAVAHVMAEDDVREVLADAYTMIGTDGMPTLDGKPHPRSYGTYPRVLEHYVRRLGLFGWEAAIHKMTGMPAAKYRLEGRGVIAPGARADLTLFDPHRVQDRATYARPKRSPEGIDYVWVGGTAVIDAGQTTGARPGRVLRRPKKDRALPDFPKAE